jgi:hypothetical protein
MGDILSSIFGGGGTQTTDQTVDPTTQSLNALKLLQSSYLFNDTPNLLNSFAQPKSDIYTGSPAVDNLFATAQQPSPDIPTTGINYDNLMSLADYIDLGINQGSNYINQVATPQILQTAALQGLDRGGAVPEAIAKATAGIGLPFVQSLPGASTSLFTAPAQAELTRANRFLTGAQTDLTNANRATTLLPFADFNRSLSERDLLRQQGVVGTAFTGLPYTPSVGTDTSKNQQPLFNFFGQGT